MTYRQGGANSSGFGQVFQLTYNFSNPTKEKSLVAVWAVIGGNSNVQVTGPAGFTLIADRPQGPYLRVLVWMYEGAPAMNSVTVGVNAKATIVVNAVEHTDMAQAGCLDKVTVLSGESYNPSTGITGVTSQPNSVVLACVANQYASTLQQSFSGAMTQLIKALSPQTWGLWNNDPDYLRIYCTIHQQVVQATGQFVLQAVLTALRPWIAILCVFKDASSGPARMTSKNQAPVVDTSSSVGTPLTVFGKLTSTQQAPVLVTGADPADRARIGPSNWQYRLGGWTGLPIGDGTPYTVEKVDGLEGWQARTSDTDLPRGDGALRGKDLQSARTIQFEIRIGSDLEGVAAQQLDQTENYDNLRRALVLQPDEDWELLWRHPGEELKRLRCRPVDFLRVMEPVDSVAGRYSFTLIAADPRHYAATERTYTVPVTPAGADPVPVSVLNLGSSAAFPKIKIEGPSSVVSQITRIELSNRTNDRTFGISAVVSRGSVLEGDMEAVETGRGVSPITIDGATKYAAWEEPRDTFLISPGANEITLATVPAGAPVKCTLTYSDTFGG